jgi:hypothetical protein
VSCELRSMACQSALLPQHIAVNQPLADTVEQLLNKQQSVAPRPVGNIFSQYHSKLLMRYNLNYWACHFMSNPILLPPARDTSSYEKVATPLSLGITVFLQHSPSSRLLPTLAHILDHVLPIAKSRGLLKITPPTQPSLQLTTSQYTGKQPTLADQYTGKQLVLADFTPYRMQAASSTQYASLDGSIMRDKNVRRLYLAIDGRKNIGELAAFMRLSTHEFHAALSLLLKQKRIQIFEPGERTVAILQSL